MQHYSCYSTDFFYFFRTESIYLISKNNVSLYKLAYNIQILILYNPSGHTTFKRHCCNVVVQYCLNVTFWFQNRTPFKQHSFQCFNGNVIVRSLSVRICNQKVMFGQCCLAILQQYCINIPMPTGLLYLGTAVVIKRNFPPQNRQNNFFPSMPVGQFFLLYLPHT